MPVFLLECREDEERQADFCRKEASSPVLGTIASFIYQWCHFNVSIMVSNNIISYSFSLNLLVFILQPFIQRRVYKASFLVFAIIVVVQYFGFSLILILVRINLNQNKQFY